MSDDAIEQLALKNLLSSVHAAAGSDIFRHIYVRDQTSGKVFDAMEDGYSSCAYVVSGILALRGLIDKPHATVATTLKEIQISGWHEVSPPRAGCIVHWPVGPEGQDHLGFFVDENTCMSNSAAERRPVLHPLILSDGRTPLGFYWHDSLAKV